MNVPDIDLRAELQKQLTTAFAAAVTQDEKLPQHVCAELTGLINSPSINGAAILNAFGKVEDK